MVNLQLAESFTTGIDDTYIHALPEIYAETDSNFATGLNQADGKFATGVNISDNNLPCVNDARG